MIETTLSGREHLNRLHRLKEAEWRTVFVYLGLGALHNALRRVAQRVRAGGHDVPDDVIQRRFDRSLENLTIFVRLVDIAVVIDNSARTPRVVAVGRHGAIEFVDDQASPALTSRLAPLIRSVRHE